MGLPTAGTTVVLIGGDSKGYLSPCGCVKPMFGGIRRQATAVQSLASGSPTVFWINASMVADVGRQNEMKAEALAEAYAEMKVEAINLGYEDARLGLGVVESVSRLSKGVLTTASIELREPSRLPARVRSGPFLVAGLSSRSRAMADMIGAKTRPTSAEAARLVREAREEGLVPVVLLDGTLDQARALARQAPGIELIVYRSASRPTDGPLLEGLTRLVTPGDRGKHLLRLEWADGRFKSYRPIDLGPEYADEPGIQGVFRRYLRRVESERLLEALPRSPSEPYAGSIACASCHSEETRIWKGSRHAQALRSLEREGQARDPDCTGCHVVGLESENGFRSRAATPNLADVGCESCHGPSKAHSTNPSVRPGFARAKDSCKACHTPDHSPTFDFDPYWAKIEH